MKAVLTVILVGLSVARPNPDSSFSSQAPMLKPGTTAYFVVTEPNQTFIALDKKASTLTAMTDDKGRDLKKDAKTSGLTRWIDESIDKEGHTVTLTINTPTCPAEGAKTVTLQALAVLQAGQDEKTEQKPLAIKVGETLDIAGLNLEVTSIGKGWGGFQQKITFQSEKPMHAIRTVEFLDPEGNTLQSKSGGAGWVSSGGKTTYSQSFHLKQRMDNVTVKVTYFAKVVNVNVKLDTTLSLGLGL
jgi:hypothetical protein